MVQGVYSWVTGTSLRLVDYGLPKAIERFVSLGD